jgi:hypothetical protein
MKIGITIDDWKLTIFKERLIRAGFQVKVGKDRSIPEGVTVLFVETQEIERLQLVVRACQAACQASKN